MAMPRKKVKEFINTAEYFSLCSETEGDRGMERGEKKENGYDANVGDSVLFFSPNRIGLQPSPVHAQRRILNNLSLHLVTCRFLTLPRACLES